MSRKVVISWLLVFIWASLIFAFSSMNSNESSKKSDTIVSNIIEISEKLNVIDKLPEKERVELEKKLDYPIRKLAHALEYFVLSILLINALKNSKIVGSKNLIITLIICFLYACSDEFHQLFVDGRSGMFTDALIDTFGSLIGILLMFLMKKNYLQE